MSTATDYELAVRVGKIVELLDVALRSSRIELHAQSRNGALDLLPWSLNLQWRAGHHFDEEEKTLVATVQLLTEMTPSRDEESGEPVLSVEAAFDLAYEVDVEKLGDIDDREDAFRAFAAVNSMYNAWPYFREYVQTAIARMGLPPHIIPTYRVPRRTSDDD